MATFRPLRASMPRNARHLSQHQRQQCHGRGRMMQISIPKRIPQGLSPGIYLPGPNASRWAAGRKLG